VETDRKERAVTQDRQFGDSDPDPNVYAAPSVDFSDPLAGSELASMRRAFYLRERAIKGLAWMNLLLAIVWLPAACGSLFFLTLSRLRNAGIDIAPSVDLPATLPTDYRLVLLAVFHIGVFGLNVALFLGLRGQRSWARWTMVAVVCTVLVVEALAAYSVPSDRAPFAILFGVCAAIGSGILYILLSAPSGEVFTRNYRDDVARTTRGMRF
jgi:hypothetical protein